MPDKLPSYRLHKSTGQAVVTLNGRDFYLGLYQSECSQVAYDRLIAEWLAHGRQLPRSGSSDELTVVELCAAYLQFAEVYYSRDGKPTSEYVALRDVIKVVRRMYGELVVHQFGPIALKGIRQSWIERGLARRRINQLVNRVRRIFKWGVENEFVPSTILHGLQAVAPLKKGRSAARETKTVGPAPDEHVDAVVPLVSRQVAAMIQLQRLTGMRPGEAVILRPCDLDCSQKIWIYKPRRHKTDYRDIAREIFIGPQAQDTLRPFLSRNPTDYCFSPQEAEAERQAKRRANRKTPLTPSQRARTARSSPQRAKRKRYDRDSYRRAIDYAIKKSGIPHWHPHQLRHNFGTRIRRDFGLDVAQVVLGHQTADVTQVYRNANRQDRGPRSPNRFWRWKSLAPGRETRLLVHELSIFGEQYIDTDPHIASYIHSAIAEMLEWAKQVPLADSADARPEAGSADGKVQFGPEKPRAILARVINPTNDPANERELFDFVAWFVRLCREKIEETIRPAGTKSPNFDRNQWLLDRQRENKTWPQILDCLNAEIDKGGVASEWGDLSNSASVAAAVIKHAKEIGNPLPTRPRGRPKKNPE